MPRPVTAIVGEEAVHRILAALGDDDVPEPRHIGAQFVRRESTAPPAQL